VSAWPQVGERLAGAKVGDTIATEESGVVSLYQVDRVTATRVFCNRVSFKKDGKMVGSGSICRIRFGRLATEADQQKGAIQKMQAFVWSLAVTPENLGAITALHEAEANRNREKETGVSPGTVRL